MISSTFIMKIPQSCTKPSICSIWADTCKCTSGWWRFSGFCYIAVAVTTRFMRPTWGQPGADRTQVGPCWPHEPCYLGASAFTNLHMGIPFLATPNILRLIDLHDISSHHIRWRYFEMCLGLGWILDHVREKVFFNLFLLLIKHIVFHDNGFVKTSIGLYNIFA